jgi:hypothetical protein
MPRVKAQTRWWVICMPSKGVDALVYNVYASSKGVDALVGNVYAQ